MKRRVVMTGVGVITPCGLDVASFWENSRSGKSYVSSVADEQDFSFKSRVAGKIGDFDWRDHGITESEAEQMGRPTQFALAAARQALADSGLEFDDDLRERAGVCIASAIADTPAAERVFARIKDCIHASEDISQDVDRHLFQKAMFNAIATTLSGRFGLHGEAFVMSTGCTGGIDAVGYGFETIAHGDANVMLVGGSDAPLTGISYSSFDAISATSQKNDDPSRASSPFDITRDGFVLAEGCGIIVLEEYEHALARGAYAYAEVKGYDSLSNAWHMTDLPKDGSPLAHLFRRVMDDAGVSPEEVDYINAHGSSTLMNDIAETNAVKDVFGDRAYEIPLSSTKSVTGHPLAAASAIEIVQCGCIIRDGIIPPTVNLYDPDPECDLDYVPHEARKLEVETILKDASGFSGIHSALLLKKVNAT